jgi:hypothetical protein
MTVTEIMSPGISVRGTKYSIVMTVIEIISPGISVRGTKDSIVIIVIYGHWFL